MGFREVEIRKSLKKHYSFERKWELEKTTKFYDEIDVFLDKFEMQIKSGNLIFTLTDIQVVGEDIVGIYKRGDHQYGMSITKLFKDKWGIVKEG